MIKSIRLSNYKSYQKADIDVKPITLFCGGNSSGKSAILKSILLMKQSFEATGDNYLLLNGPYTQNGLFDNLRCNSKCCQENSQMEILLSFEIDAQNPSFRDICRSIRFSSKRDDIKAFQIDANFSFLENKELLQIGEINSAEIIVKTIYSSEAKEYEGEIIESIIKIEQISGLQRYRIMLKNFPIPRYSSDATYAFEYIDYNIKNAMCYFRGMQLVSLYQDGLSEIGISALPVLYTIFRAVSNELNRVEYIGPLRDTPARQYFSQAFYSNIGIKGENTAQYLGQYGESSVKVILPNKNTPQEMLLKEAVAKWAEFLGIEEVSVRNSVIPGAKITQIMIGKQNIVDVGFGISQVLPILVEGLTIVPGSTLILEQPEIHLNPKMQMDIADFLLAMAKHNKNVIIETHSDHIINRIVRRCLEDKFFMDNVKIYFISKNQDNCSELEEIKINEDIGIDGAPAGFFDQYADEADLILRAGYNNIKAKRSQSNG